MASQTKGQVLFHKQGGQITNPKVVRAFIDDLADGTFLMRCESSKVRTLSQNAYYWVTVVPMLYEEFKRRGYGADIPNTLRMHEILKEKFLKVAITSEEMDEATGEVEELFEPLTYTRHTKDLSTREFNHYLECIWTWAKDKLDLDIPPPGFQTSMFD